MKAIVALQKLIAEHEVQIKSAKKKLADHESGENKLTSFMKTSTEASLEESEIALTKHKAMLAELMSQNLEELEEEERIQEELERKKFKKLQKFRLLHDKRRPNDEKLEAMSILDEFPAEIVFDDEGVFDIAAKSIEIGLGIQDEMDKKLIQIKKDFEQLLKACKKEDIKELELLNIRIPIIVLHFHVLVTNIEQIHEDEHQPKFNGFPKYEDWWIKELWTTHQAYFALYKWKTIISNLCITHEQKILWEEVFSNWIFTKKLLSSKGKLAFQYNFAFDELLKQYAQLEEELDASNLASMESIINRVILKEDFTKVLPTHKIETDYLNFKREKLK